MTFEEVKGIVENFRKEYGHDVCTDAWLSEDGIYAGYTFQPDDVAGYMVEIYLPSGESRHCGLGDGCFWTDWE